MKERRLLYKYLIPAALMFVSLINFVPNLFAQTPTYPKEIRGYKVVRRDVEAEKPKKQSKDNTESNSDSELDQLIQFGQPVLTNATPRGITLEIPIVVGPAKNSGHIDFLVFEDMVINGTSVEIAEYQHSFDLQKKEPLTLQDPLRLYISLPSVVFATIDEWSDSKQTWPVTGRVYVFGKFKKSFFSFKRCVPVELNLKMRNPLGAQ